MRDTKLQQLWLRSVSQASAIASRSKNLEVQYELFWANSSKLFGKTANRLLSIENQYDAVLRRYRTQNVKGVSLLANAYHLYKELAIKIGGEGFWEELCDLIRLKLDGEEIWGCPVLWWMNNYRDRRNLIGWRRNMYGWPQFLETFPEVNYDVDGFDQVLADVGSKYEVEFKARRLDLMQNEE